MSHLFLSTSVLLSVYLSLSSDFHHNSTTFKEYSESGLPSFSLFASLKHIPPGYTPQCCGWTSYSCGFWVKDSPCSIQFCFLKIRNSNLYDNVNICINKDSAVRNLMPQDRLRLACICKVISISWTQTYMYSHVATLLSQGLSETFTYRLYLLMWLQNRKFKLEHESELQACYNTHCWAPHPEPLIQECGEGRPNPCWLQAARGRCWSPHHTLRITALETHTRPSHFLNFTQETGSPLKFTLFSYKTPAPPSGLPA